MSLRLALASLWMPRGAVVRELLRVEELTNQALDGLMAHGPADPEPPDLEERRPQAIQARMAMGHRRRVDHLLTELGREEGIRRGREALFPVGVRLGEEARSRLRVGAGTKDLERAARAVYRMLGIDVRMSFSGKTGSMMVSRCSLSSHYDRDTCVVLSATDEGMVSGLSPGTRMRFVEHITSGARECRALVEMEGA